MTAKWIKARQTRYGAYAVAYILVVLAVLGALNWLANRHNKSLDTTSTKKYSLSDQTIKIASNLKQPVTILYFDKTTQFPAAKDLLGRYDNLSTNLNVEYVDPQRKPQVAREYGIRQLGSIIVRASEKKEEARSLSEEEVTSAMIRALKTGQRTVCFTAGAGERSIEEATETSLTGFKELIEKNNYKTETVNLLEKPEIPQRCSVVAVAGPRVDYPQPVLDVLKKHVESGGRALFLVEPPLQAGKDRISENQGLVDLLASWGAKPEKNQIIDVSGIGGLYGIGPEVALASIYGTHPISRDLKGTATGFAITRSLEVKPGDKTTTETIVSTSKNSFAVTQLSGELRRIDPSKGEQKSFPVAAAGLYRTGEQGKEGRLVVVGSAEWVANYILRFGGNRDLAMNMLNWLSSDEDLISIRPKDPEDRRLDLSRSQMMLVRTTSQFVIPLVVILLGVLVWWKRR